MFGIYFSEQRQGYNTVEIVKQQNKKNTSSRPSSARIIANQ